MLIYDLMKVLIIVFGVGTTYKNVDYLMKARKLRPSYWWIKLGIAIISLYWAVYYAFSLVDIRFDILPHQILVRAGVLLTVAFLFAGATISNRRYKKL